MRLSEQLEREGGFLFRRRSFLPLVIIPAALPALYDATGFEALWEQTLEDLWIYACMLLSVVGLASRWGTVGLVAPETSGRNTRSQLADALNTAGMHSIVRNPLYLGNFVAILGLAVSTKSWWFVLLVCLAYWLYIERIIAAEERFLAEKFGARYDEWARKTPAFISNFSCWCRPTKAFSLRTVLRREYDGILAVAVSYLGLEVVADLAIEGEPLSSRLAEDRVWVWFFLTSSVVFLGLRALKNHTAQ